VTLRQRGHFIPKIFQRGPRQCGPFGFKGRANLFSASLGSPHYRLRFLESSFSILRLRPKPARRSVIPIEELAGPIIREADFKAAGPWNGLMFDDANAVRAHRTSYLHPLADLGPTLPPMPLQNWNAVSPRYVAARRSCCSPSCLGRQGSSAEPPSAAPPGIHSNNPHASSLEGVGRFTCSRRAAGTGSSA
jgi:hypothetical protein